MKTIDFFSTVPGLTETFPIRPAKEVLPRWIYSARTDYLKHKDTYDQHIYRCPGIIDVLTTGYVIPAWHDIDIETDGDRFKMTIPDQELEKMLGKDTVQEQTHNGLIRFVPKRPWSVKSILKINTPWHVMAPRGVKFLMVGMPYPDDFGFESATGILDPGYSSELNVQGYWNFPKPGKYSIKAGTPLAQIIPITEKNFNYVVRDASDRDSLWLKKRRYLTFFGFIFNRSKTKDAYIKHIEKG